MSISLNNSAANVKSKSLYYLGLFYLLHTVDKFSGIFSMVRYLSEKLKFLSPGPPTPIPGPDENFLIEFELNSRLV
jgi:hypothetical protein